MIQETTLSDFTRTRNRIETAEPSILEFYNERFFTIDKVELLIFWPTDKNGKTPPPETLFSSLSWEVMKVLDRVYRNKGAIITFNVGGQPIPSFAHANAVVLTHNRGHKKGTFSFWAWRLHEVDCGYEGYPAWLTKYGFEGYLKKIGCDKPMKIKQTRNN